MSSVAAQNQLLNLSTLLQILRAGAWCTAGVVLAVQGLDPALDGQLPALRPLELHGATLSALGLAMVVNGLVQAWAGYHVSTWRKTKMWLLTTLVAAVDAVFWAEIGLRLDARGASSFAIAGFVLCAMAALAAIGVAAGRGALSGHL